MPNVKEFPQSKARGANLLLLFERGKNANGPTNACFHYYLKRTTTTTMG